MSAFEKNNFRCVVLNVLQPVHLITDAVNKQIVALVQLTKNKRTRQLSSDFSNQEIVDRANSSHLKVCVVTDVISMLLLRQSSVSVDPEIF